MAIKPDQDGGPPVTGLWSTKGTVKLAGAAAEISVSGLAGGSLYRVTGWLDPASGATPALRINDQSGAIYDFQKFQAIATTITAAAVNNGTELAFSNDLHADTGFEAWVFQPVVGNAAQHGIVALIYYSKPTNKIGMASGMLDGYNQAIEKIAVVNVGGANFNADSFLVVEEATS